MNATEELPYMYPWEYGFGSAVTLLGGNVVCRKPSGSNNRTRIASANVLPSIFSTMRPSKM